MSIRARSPARSCAAIRAGFNCEGDGAGRGFHHWTKKKGPLAPGNAKVDLWPDVSELGPGERFATGFRHPDGRVAEVSCSAGSRVESRFDEVDEATAIFKCTNDVPVGGESQFVTYESLPSDFYLRLTGSGAKMLRAEIPISDTIPIPTK